MSVDIVSIKLEMVTCVGAGTAAQAAHDEEAKEKRFSGKVYCRALRSLARSLAAARVRPLSPSLTLTLSHAYCESAISCLTLSFSSADISPNLLLTL